MTTKGWNEFGMSIHAFSNMPKSLFHDKESKCANHLGERCTMLGERKGTP
jgi:hypothetical protein